LEDFSSKEEKFEQWRYKNKRTEGNSSPGSPELLAEGEPWALLIWVAGCQHGYTAI